MEYINPLLHEEHQVEMESALEYENCRMLSAEAEIGRWGLAPAVWRRLLACFVVLLFGAAPFALMANYSEAFHWGQASMLFSLALMMDTVLRPESIACWQRLRSVPFLKARWNWFRLFVSTTVLVFLVELVSIANYGRCQILPYGTTIVLNSLLLICLVGVVFSVTNRFAFSIVFIYAAYVLASIANIVKAQYLQTTIRPLDVHYLTTFQEFFTYFFGTTIAVLLIAATVLWIGLLAALWHRGRYRVGLRSRVLLGFFSVVGLFGAMYCDKNPVAAYLLECLDLKKNLSNGMYCAERRGFLFEFLSDIPDSIPRTPANYDKVEIARIMGERGCTPTPTAPIPKPREHVNVVFYLIESFMDPLDLHIKFTSDPIPTFRAATREHTSGYVIVPGEFMGSVATEFEVLTGMSCSFLPQGACAYAQYVQRDIPNLFTFFREHGYRTFTAHAGRPCLYNRVPVYRHMHVDETIWLTEKMMERAGMPINPEGRAPINVDIAGRDPTDDSLVDEVINTSKTHPRYFMYASANSTHSPYNYDGYLASDLDVRDPMSEPARQELKTYINAIRTADRALKKMLNYFRQSPRKTIVIVIGDHWPPFEHSSEIYAASGCLMKSETASLPINRRVPLLIWSNFSGKTPDIVRSTNFLGAEILSRIGIEPTGMLALNDSLRVQLSVLSTNCLCTRDGKRTARESAPPSLTHLLDDYQLLQYDLLLGKQYAQEGPAKVLPLSQSADGTKYASPYGSTR